MSPTNVYSLVFKTCVIQQICKQDKKKEKQVDEDNEHTDEDEYGDEGEYIKEEYEGEYSEYDQEEGAGHVIGEGGSYQEEVSAMEDEEYSEYSEMVSER